MHFIHLLSKLIQQSWRVRNHRKKHELRGGTKYAAARDYWRLNPPFTVQPRKAIDWNKIR